MDQTGESEGERSRIQSGCSNTAKFSFLRFSTVWAVSATVMDTDWRPVPSPCLTLVRPFFEPLTQLTTHCDMTLFPYCTDIILCTSTTGTPSAHKNGSLPSALLWCKWNWECPCLWQKNSWQKWTVKITPAPQWKESSRPCVFCHAQPEVQPTAKHVPIVWIIFDSPTYLQIDVLLAAVYHLSYW